MEKVAIFVLNWNGMAIKYKDSPILESCLRSLIKTTKRHNIKILVEDRESQDESRNFIKSNFKDVDILSIEGTSIPYSHNFALEYAFRKYKDIKYVLFIQNDIVFEDDNWLDKILEAARKNKKAGIIDPTLYYPNGKAQHA